jgi:hypothetical protein
MVGGLLLSCLALGMQQSAEWEPARYELTLAAEPDGAIHFSAWEDGRVVTDHNPRDGQTLTFHRTFVWSDGCLWEGTEELTPIGDAYAYHYSDRMLRCGDEPPRGIPTEHHGVVHAQRTRSADVVTVASSALYSVHDACGTYISKTDDSSVGQPEYVR